MCDEDTVRDNEEFLQRQNAMTRRGFGAMAGGSALAFALPAVAGAPNISESDVLVETPDGTADCAFYHPEGVKSPGVIIWPDIIGLRPAFRMMAKRLAQSGYAVLVVNPYYRGAKAPVVAEGASFQDPAVREKVLPLARALSSETTATDAKAFVEFLDNQDSVDSTRGIGTTGYCLGGPMTFQTAAAQPERIRGIGSFHGGGLATDKETSPHLLIPKMNVAALIAVAENDDGRDPDAKTTLKDAFAQASLKAEIEVYPGTLHGWCPPDSRVYNEEQAERAWARLLVLFEGALA